MKHCSRPPAPSELPGALLTLDSAYSLLHSIYSKHGLLVFDLFINIRLWTQNSLTTMLATFCQRELFIRHGKTLFTGYKTRQTYRRRAPGGSSVRGIAVLVDGFKTAENGDRSNLKTGRLYKLCHRWLKYYKIVSDYTINYALFIWSSLNTGPDGRGLGIIYYVGGVTAKGTGPQGRSQCGLDSIHRRSCGTCL